MKLVTTSVKFELDSKLNETAVIMRHEDDNSYGFITSKGYDSHETYTSFDRCYTELKRYEMESIKKLKYS